MKSSGSQVGMGYRERQPSEPGRRWSRTRQQGARHPCSCPGTARSTASTGGRWHNQPWSEEREKRTSGSGYAAVQGVSPKNTLACKISPLLASGTICLTITGLASIQRLSTLNLHRVCSGSASQRTAKHPPCLPPNHPQTAS